MEDKRTFTVHNADGTKTDVPLRYIKAGQIFTIREPDGELVGNGMWQADDDAEFVCGRWSVTCCVLADDAKAALPATVHE